MLALSLLLLVAPPADPPLRVAIDSAAHTVTLLAGPFTIAGTDPGLAHDAGHGHGGDELPVLRFEWPIEGWLRGARLLLRDADGQRLPRHLVHHVNVVNYARRQLFYPAVERTLAMGQETEDIRLPSTVGIPVSPGMAMGLILAWHNPDTTALQGVTVELVLEYLPHNQNPRPISVLPAYLDVVDPIGRPVGFDLPPGRQEFSALHVAPVTGRIIGVGGHLHDHGLELALTEVGNGRERTVVTLGTKRDAEGRLVAVERKLPGVRGRGLPLKAGARYRVTGRYENPTGATIPDGAMVHLIMLVVPNDPSDWPAVNPHDEDYQRDVAWLAGRGQEGAAAEEHAHAHEP